jgi:hypothetical protein
MSKQLFILIGNGGDGSYYPQYVLDPKVIEYMENLADSDQLDWEAMGCDGDGFHYDTINVPDDATPESLGISVYTLEDVKLSYPAVEGEEE